MKQKIIGISFFYLWIFQCVASFLFYQIERDECHQQNFSLVTSKKPKLQTETFSFADTETIHWEVVGKELIVKGKLYDVVSYQQGKNNITLVCIPDKKEDRIVLNYHQAGKDKSKPGSANHSIKKNTDLSCLQLESHSIFNLGSFVKNEVATICNRLCETHIELVSPPPEC